MRATFRNLYDQFNMAAFIRDRRTHAMSVLRWALILVPMAAMVGTLCAAFLWSLDAVTRLRFAFPWLLYLLPIGGFVVGLLYHLTGRSVEGGNNLIVEQIHEPGGGATADGTADLLRHGGDPSVWRFGRARRHRRPVGRQSRQRFRSRAQARC
ncbi:hypothetical protein QP175_19915 [Sphingomonas aerolata]